MRVRVCRLGQPSSSDSPRSKYASSTPLQTRARKANRRGVELRVGEEHPPRTQLQRITSVPSLWRPVDRPDGKSWDRHGGSVGVRSWGASLNDAPNAPAVCRPASPPPAHAENLEPRSATILLCMRGRRSQARARNLPGRSAMGVGPCGDASARGTNTMAAHRCAADAATRTSEASQRGTSPAARGTAQLQPGNGRRAIAPRRALGGVYRDGCGNPVATARLHRCMRAGVQGIQEDAGLDGRCVRKSEPGGIHA